MAYDIGLVELLRNTAFFTPLARIAEEKSRPIARRVAAAASGATTCRMIGRNSALSSGSSPKPSAKSRRNARHPTTRKWPGETRRPPRPTTPPLASLVETDALTGALRHGILGTISATTETENTRECRGGAWLPFLDTYRTMCLAPEPQFQRVLEEIGGLELSGA
jgi:hypothetical protein